MKKNIKKKTITSLKLDVIRLLHTILRIEHGKWHQFSLIDLKTHLRWSQNKNPRF